MVISSALPVAGYPEGHPDKIKPDTGKVTAEDMEGEIAYLKKKIEAGGDYIITQLFLDNSLFLEFVKKCRAAGITCPILPGMLPLLAYGGFQRMTGFVQNFCS